MKKRILLLGFLTLAIMAIPIKSMALYFFGWSWPADNTTITSAFGPRIWPVKGENYGWQDFHNGIDIGVRYRALRAVESGMIGSIIPRDKITGDYGNILGINYSWWYCHLDDSHTATGVNNSGLPSVAKGLVWKMSAAKFLSNI